MPEKRTRILLAGGREAENLVRGALRDVTALEIERLAGRGALEQALAAWNWDLVLAEPEAGDLDALQLLDAMLGHGIDVPLVLLAETGAEDIVLRCLERGVDQCLLRNPVHLRRLPALLQLLQARAAREEERRKVEQALRESRERYRDIFDNTSDLIQCLAPDGSFLYTNRAWRETLGYTEEEVKALHLTDVLHPDSMLCCQDRFERLKKGEELSEIQFKFVAKNGETIYLSGACGSILRDGKAVSTRGIFKNITDKVQAEEALRASEARYQALYENAPDINASVAMDETILSINRNGARMLGYEVEELVGRSFLDLVHSADQARVRRYLRQQFTDFAADHGIEFRKLRRDGSVIWVHQCVSLEPETSEPRLLVVCRDVTERRKLEEKLAYQAAHDPLTNLINRREFESRLRRLLARPASPHDEHVLCYLDLDQFKVINDTCGHIAGDELLRQVAALLSRQIRSRDTLARLGGDEFAVLMEHCPLEQAEKLAERMRQAIEEFRFQWQSRRFNIGVSIGVVQVTGGGLSMDAVLSQADSACYAAKDQGRNRVYVCRPNDATLSGQVGDMRWASYITEALEADRFTLYAQPILPCRAEQAGLRFEILLRLRDGDKVIRPGTFMPAAERYNLSTRLDRWVLETLIQWLGRSPGVFDQVESCSVNLSALSLCDESFRQYALELLAGAGLPGGKLCFEITETAAISNLSRATGFIQALKDAGHQVALDDFGSGLSSFAYLKNLPIDMIKIDGAFVRQIAESELDQALVRSICDIAGMMGKQTTAEYVEDAAALEVLRGIGVDYVQGYHLGRPEPLPRLLDLPLHLMEEPARYKA